MENCKEESLVAITERFAFWMRLIGIPFNAEIKSNNPTKFWSIGFGWVSIFFNIIINLWSLAIIKIPKTTVDWNELITTINFAFAMPTCQVALMISVAPKWKDFVYILHQIDQLKLLKCENYLQCRKIFFYGLFALITMVHPKYFENYTLYSK